MLPASETQRNHHQPRRPQPATEHHRPNPRRRACAVVRSSADPELGDLRGNPKRPYKRAARPRQPKKAKRRAPRSTEALDRARAALKDNPDATLTAVAKAAGVSRSTVVNARDDLAREERRNRKHASVSPASAARETSKTGRPTERRARAQRFLRDALAHGPKRVSDIEEQAVKAHVDEVALGQARADLGILTSRANTPGSTLSVQWSLPG